MHKTPLTDFIASLVDPVTLDRFRADPVATAAAAGLSEDLANLVIAGDPGTIHLRCMQELERAGLAPIVSDKLGVFVQPLEKVEAHDAPLR